MTIFVVLDQHGGVMPIPDPLTKNDPDYYCLMNYLGIHGHEPQLYGRTPTWLIVNGVIQDRSFSSSINAYVKDKAQAQATVDEMIRVRHRPEWLK